MLPSGDVTFVFTDVEASTRLFQRAGDAYAGLLAHHFALVREAFSTWNGHEVRTIGDSLFAAFEHATDAVEACVEAQRLLLTHDWPPDRTLRVRMGVHTGEAAPTDGDYVSLAVHQAARISAAANGGQIFLSSTTVEGLKGASPAMAELVDLGLFWLRDFDEPQQLFAVRHAESAHDEPPPRTPSATATNLPRSRATFVGRDDELAAIRKALPEARLVTIVGPGGVGKTRTAIEVASEAGPRYPAGIWFVDLGGVVDADLVVATIAATLGVRPRLGEDQLAATIATIDGNPTLLVVDNCEQVVDEAARVIDRLLGGCDSLAVLATSRVPLRVDGEQVLRLTPLAAPDADATIDAIAHNDAVRLFADRAARASLGFTVTADVAADIAWICAQLDGLPLALELAAARAGECTIAELRSTMTDVFAAVAAGLRTAPQRHQTLDAVTRWSWDLLDEREQRVLRRLSVFRAGFSDDAADVVAASPATNEALRALVDRSLVVDAGDRYSMLETIRAFAADRAAEAGDEDDAKDHLVEWVRSVAQRLADATYYGGDVEPLHALDGEHANVSAALTRVVEHPTPAGAQLALAMQAYWFSHGLPSEQVYWLDRLVETFPQDDSVHWVLRMRRGSVVAMLGDLAKATDDLESTLAYFGADAATVSPDLAPKLPMYFFQARASLGLLAARERRHDDAIALLRLAIDEAPTDLVTTDTVTTRLNLGAVLIDCGRLDEAVEEMERAIAVADERGLHVAGMLGRSNLATLYARKERTDEALGLYELVLAGRREHDDRGGIASTLANMADLALKMGDMARAVDAVAESVVVAAEVGLAHVVVTDLLTAGEIASAIDRHADAAWFVGVRSTLGAGLPPALVNDPTIDDLRARALAAGEDGAAWDAAVASSAALPTAEVVRLAAERVLNLVP